MSDRKTEAIQWFENEIAKLKAIGEQSPHGYSQDEAYQLRAFDAALSALRECGKGSHCPLHGAFQDS